VQNRVPKIDNTCEELNWQPRVTMKDALERIFESYRAHVRDAQDLMN
jgi:nucleoside-diphosphate-sugar epimerase